MINRKQKLQIFTKIFFRAILVLSATFINAQSSDNECQLILKDGLYSYTKMTYTRNFKQDIKTYFLSEQFRSDPKNSKWGTSVPIPIDGQFHLHML